MAKFVAHENWFGLGLRLGAQAVDDLANDPPARAEALEMFGAHQLYPMSVNAFPYGKFHAGPVKEHVYAPDWRMTDRRNYTFDVCDILSEWLPEGIDGSISTVPCSYKPWITDQAGIDSMAQNLAAVAAYLAAVRDDTGKDIHLGLEPEPSCYLETTEETVTFFKDVLWKLGVDEVSRIRKCGRSEAEEVMRRHIGVCLDTCHVALQFEEPLDALRRYRAEGIRISKVQLSAALACPAVDDAWENLQAFAEGTYLHQVKARTTDGKIRSWVDLPQALADVEGRKDLEDARVHFHVPLFFKEYGLLSSTAALLDMEFFHELRTGATSHVEIETYTFDVLPAAVQPGDVVKSIAREFAWVTNHL